MHDEPLNASDLGSPEYKPPRNAVAELYTNAPREFLSAIQEIEEEVVKAKPTGTWPGVPYHYGMGRIRAYDEWLATLTEEERANEIARCRSRYEAHYDARASLIRVGLRNRGIDLGDGNADREAVDEGEPQPLLTRREETLASRQRLEGLLGPDLEPDRPPSRSRTSRDEPTPGGRRGRGR